MTRYQTIPALATLWRENVVSAASTNDTIDLFGENVYTPIAFSSGTAISGETAFASDYLLELPARHAERRFLLAARVTAIFWARGSGRCG